MLWLLGHFQMQLKLTAVGWLAESWPNLGIPAYSWCWCVDHIRAPLLLGCHLLESRKCFLPLYILNSQVEATDVLNSDIAASHSTYKLEFTSHILLIMFKNISWPPNLLLLVESSEFRCYNKLLKWIAVNNLSLSWCLHAALVLKANYWSAYVNTSWMTVRIDYVSMLSKIIFASLMACHEAPHCLIHNGKKVLALEEMKAVVRNPDSTGALPCHLCRY